MEQITRLINTWNILYYMQFFLYEKTMITHQGERYHVWKCCTYTLTRGPAHSARAIGLAVSSCAIVHSGQQ
jgi:hypothetical protein